MMREWMTWACLERGVSTAGDQWKNDGEKDQKKETLGCLSDDQGEAELGMVEKQRSESGVEEGRLGSKKEKRKSYE